MQRYYAVSKKPIPLGYAGENLAREIAFDLKDLKSIYGDGSAQLMVRRAGEDVRYPVSLTVDGDFAIWKVTEADSAIPGCDGSCELSYTTENGVLAKSETWATFVLASMTCDTCDPPEVAENWMSELRKSAAETQFNADSAAVSATSASESAATAEEWAKKAEEFANSSGTGGTGTNGKDGKDGVGITSIKRTNGDGSPGTTDTYTITLTDGTFYTFTVYNGADGEDGKDGADGVGGGTGGANGKDGITPHIGSNGNWFLGDTDTGIKAKGEDGKDGQDGYTPVKGVDYFDGKDGMDGTDGQSGQDGNGIQSVERTAGDGSAGTTDTYTITMTDGSTAQFTVYNGKDGADGEGGNGGQASIMVNGILKGDGTGNVTAAVAGVDYAMPGAGSLIPIIDVMVYTGAEVTCTDGVTTFTATSVDGHCVFEIPHFGRWLVSAELDGTKASEWFTVDAVKLYKLSLWVKGIYGAYWSGSSSTAWTRTDASADFRDPTAALSGGTGSSPFDDLYPWAGMKRVSDPEAGELVAIPKYWYKWTLDASQGLKLQIADYPVEGFNVSPAHADRGDGHGERDVVYIGRYRCGANYTSQSGITSVTNLSITNFRAKLSALGEGIYQQDYAMHWTIAMLYLVEFADWNSQKCIGMADAGNHGGTDNMLYHTGTVAGTYSSKATNHGCQYRYIEGLWAAGCEWLDGCYYTSEGLWIINNPTLFNSNKQHGVLVGLPANSGGCPKVMQIPDVAGYEWALYASVKGGSTSTYIPDSQDGGSFSSYPAIQRGYDDTGEVNTGLFALDYNSYSATGYRTRLMKLPNKEV